MTAQPPDPSDAALETELRNALGSEHAAHVFPVVAIAGHDRPGPQLPPPVSKTAPDAQHHRAEQTQPPTPERAANMPPDTPASVSDTFRELAEQLAARTAERDQARAELAEVRATLDTFAAAARTSEPTFYFRPAGENKDVTVALQPLDPCLWCGQPIHPGAFVIEYPTGDYAHELCAEPRR